MQEYILVRNLVENLVADVSKQYIKGVGNRGTQLSDNVS